MGLFSRRPAPPPRGDEAHGDNGSHARRYDGGTGRVRRDYDGHEPIRARYLTTFPTSTIAPAELRPVERHAARPSRYIAQGSAAHPAQSFQRAAFTGGHTVVRRGAHGPAAVAGTPIRDVRSRFYRTRPRPVAVARVGDVPMGSSGDRIAPPGTPQMSRVASYTPEGRRIPPTRMWNGGPR